MSKPVELVCRKQVLAALGVTQNTLRRWIRIGKFPAPALILGRQRWYKSDVEHYIEEQFRKARQSLVRATDDCGA